MHQSFSSKAQSWLVLIVKQNVPFTLRVSFLLVSFLAEYVIFHTWGKEHLFHLFHLSVFSGYNSVQATVDVDQSGFTVMWSPK